MIKTITKSPPKPIYQTQIDKPDENESVLK